MALSLTLPSSYLKLPNDTFQGMDNVQRASIQFGMHADSWESTKVVSEMLEAQPIFQQKFKVLKEMSIISWCVFLKSRTNFSLFYPKHSLKNQLLYEQ